MKENRADDVVMAWRDQCSPDLQALFEQWEVHAYMRDTVISLASDEAVWTITDYEDHPVLLLAGETAFALLAFNAPSDEINLKGALHPLDEGLIRVSFDDRAAEEEVVLPDGQKGRPKIRRWSFDWHGRLQIPIQYWLPSPWWSTVDQVAEKQLEHHRRQLAAAHKLARAAGWPLVA